MWSSAHSNVKSIDSRRPCRRREMRSGTLGGHWRGFLGRDTGWTRHIQRYTMCLPKQKPTLCVLLQLSGYYPVFLLLSLSLSFLLPLSHTHTHHLGADNISVLLQCTNDTLPLPADLSHTHTHRPCHCQSSRSPLPYLSLLLIFWSLCVWGNSAEETVSIQFEMLITLTLTR